MFVARDCDRNNLFAQAGNWSKSDPAKNNRTIKDLSVQESDLNKLTLIFYNHMIYLNFSRVFLDYRGSHIRLCHLVSNRYMLRLQELIQSVTTRGEMSWSTLWLTMLLIVRESTSSSRMSHSEWLTYSSEVKIDISLERYGLKFWIPHVRNRREYSRQAFSMGKSCMNREWLG